MSESVTLEAPLPQNVLEHIAAVASSDPGLGNRLVGNAEGRGHTVTGDQLRLVIDAAHMELIDS